MISEYSQQGSVTMQCARITRAPNITISLDTAANFSFASWTRPFGGLMSTPLDSNPQLPFDPEHLPEPEHPSPVPFELSTPPASPPPHLTARRGSDAESSSNEFQPMVFEEDLAARVAQMVLADESSETWSHLKSGTLDEPEVLSPLGSCSPPQSPTSPTPSGSQCLVRSSNETRLRKKSATPRRVSFADECGRALVTTHIFSEPGFLGAPHIPLLILSRL